MSVLIFNIKTNDFHRTLTGRISKVKIGSRKYNKLRSEGYEHREDAVIMMNFCELLLAKKYPQNQKMTVNGSRIPLEEGKKYFSKLLTKRNITSTSVLVKRNNFVQSKESPKDLNTAVRDKSNKSVIEIRSNSGIVELCSIEVEKEITLISNELEMVKQKREEYIKSRSFDVRSNYTSIVRKVGQVKRFFDNDRQYMLVGMTSNKCGETIKYNLTIDSFLNNGKWDQKFALKKMIKFYECPASFKSYSIHSDELAHLEKLKKQNNQIGTSSDEYLGYEPDDIMYDDVIEDLTNGEVDDLREDMLEDFNDIINSEDNFNTEDIDYYDDQEEENDSDIGSHSKPFSLYTQINNELGEASCFHSSLYYYNIESKHMGVYNRSDLIEELNNTGLSYVIYSDTISIDRKEVCKLRDYNNVIFKNIKGKKEKLYGINIPDQIFESRFINKEDKNNSFNENYNRDDILVFALSFGNNIDHIFVPSIKKNQLYVSMTGYTIYRLNKSNNPEPVHSQAKKNGVNYIYWDIETIEKISDKRYFEPISVSIINYSSDKYDIGSHSEEEIISLLSSDKNASFRTKFIMQLGCEESEEDESVKRMKSNLVYKFTNIHFVKKLNIWKELKQFFMNDKVNILMSYNGAKFDNLFLLKSLREARVFTNASYANGLLEIQSCVGEDYIFKTQDLKRLLGPGSLESACEVYIKNPLLKKKCARHLFKEANNLYKEGKIMLDESFLLAFIEYNNLDVESMMVLHCNLLNNLRRILNLENGIEGDKLDKSHSEVISAAQWMFKYQESSLKKTEEFTKTKIVKGSKKITKDDSKIPQKFKLKTTANAKLVAYNRSIKRLGTPNKLTKYQSDKILELEHEVAVENLSNEKIKNDYALFKALKTGGRCQAKSLKMIDEIENSVQSKIEVRSLDVASLYPFTMMCYNNGYFMSGDLKSTTKYEEGKTGIYIIEIIQRQIHDEMIYYCEKTSEGNNWDCWNKKISVVAISIEIEILLKNKPHWEFNVLCGYYTEESIRGIDYFGKSLIPFMKEKANQDLYKLNKDSRYNGGLRELSKTKMNSLSGKYLQSVSRIDTIFNKDENNLKKIELSQEAYLSKCIQKDKKLHIGLFIYGLSKLFMYQNVYSAKSFIDETRMTESEFIYTDTDSNKMVYKETFDKWMNIRGSTNMTNYIWEDVMNMDLGYTKDTPMYYNGLGIKCMGQIEDECGDSKFDNAIFCDKKEYMYWNSKTNEYKALTKGVPMRAFMVIESDNINVGNGDEESLKTKPINIYYQYKKEICSVQKFHTMNKNYQLNASLKCEINELLYDNNGWELNELLSTDLEQISAEIKLNTSRGKTFGKKYIDQYSMMFRRKMMGKKTFILMKVFRRCAMTQNIRVEFIVKRI